jgi:hypothetical protein
VYLQTTVDGNVVVLHARTDGRVEILFPSAPAGDPFVRAGTYEIRGPADGEPFTASGPEGRGMVVAALSPDPIWFDEFARYGKWNDDALTAAGSGADPEALLTEVVQRMLGDGSFNYDVATYYVTPRAATTAEAAPYAPEPAGGCIDCYYTPYYTPGYFIYPGYFIGSGALPLHHFAHHRLDVIEGGIGARRHFPQRQLRIPAASSDFPQRQLRIPAAGSDFPQRQSRIPGAGPAHWIPPDRPAIAYSGHSPVAVPEPLHATQPRAAVRPPRPWPADAMAPRRRIPDAPVAASSSPATWATRAVPLVTRDRTAAARAAVPSRSVLLTRVVHVNRSPSSTLMPATAPASSGFVAATERLLAAPAARPSATGGLVAMPGAAPALLFMPGSQVAAPPGVATGAAQAGIAAGAPAPASGGASMGVPLGATRTAGWRH